MSRFCLSWLLAVPLWGLAAIDPYTFSSAADQARYRALVDELRCPMCQNQNIADSDAPIARDLRQQVYQMLAQGQSDGQIIDYLVARYGDFVRYDPPLKPATWLLWLGPPVLLLLGGLGLWRLLRRAGGPPS
mgnify:CR=1 FL=1